MVTFKKLDDGKIQPYLEESDHGVVSTSGAHQHPTTTQDEFKVDDTVVKETGDYFFMGYVVAKFHKCNKGPLRYVVENADGVLHIFAPNQLRLFAPRPYESGATSGEINAEKE